MKELIRDKVYEVIAASKTNGITINEIAKKTGLELRQVHNAIKPYRDRYVVHRTSLCNIYFSRAENPGKDQVDTLKNKILERLKNGEVLNQYWKGEKQTIDDYGDPYLLAAVKELWLKGEPIIRRKNEDTRLWEYIYVKQ